MINLFKNTKALLTVLTVGSIATTASAAQALTLKVEVENQGPDGGVALTPVWVGFHDGSFDIYNGGLSSQPGLERIAEDGNTTPISIDFNNNQTYIDNSSGTPVSATVLSSQVGTRVDGAIGGVPITAGTSDMSMFEVTPDDSNLYFSYASMILPSNDYFLANADPLAHSLSTLFSGVDTSISFEIGLPGSFRDAGTEVNDFTTSAGNPLFPGLPVGQTGPNQGVDENGVITSVTDSFANFENRPTDFDTNFANLNFNNESLYPDGIARVTISVVEEVESVPESSTTVGLMAIAGLFFGAALRRRNNHLN